MTNNVSPLVIPSVIISPLDEMNKQPAGGEQSKKDDAAQQKNKKKTKVANNKK